MARSLAWYMERLRRMSVREVVSRVDDAVYSMCQQAGFRTAANPPPARIADCADWIMPCLDLDKNLYESCANRIHENNFSVFAVDRFGGSGPVNWNYDVLTGTQAPKTFGPSVDLHSTKVVGNIKYLWEPNRHLELVVLAQAYVLTKDERHLYRIRYIVESWIEQCPYLQGANWSSGLELAIRLINWSITWQLIGGLESSMFEGDDGKEFQALWLNSIYQHMHFVNGHYSKFSSANNHLIGEVSGVYIAACTWPYWKKVEQWKRKAWVKLTEAAARQNYSDGVNKEQAVSYQQFVLDFFILSGLAGRASGDDFPEEYWATIERMIGFIHSIMDAGGNMPMIGDADDGYVVRLSQEPDFCPYKSLLASGAILFKRADFAQKSGLLDDKTRSLLDAEAWLDIQSSAKEAEYEPVQEFNGGGYYILGERFNSEEEIRMMVDAGPLGYLSIAAHGHADALAVYLSVFGREFLIDPGTYTYHGKPEWRRFFRSTKAHNTAEIDGLDQSVQAGGFMWAQHAGIASVDFDSRDGRDRFKAEHDGYTRLEDPLVHERAISRTGRDFKIVDTMRCQGRHTVKRCWHFSEQCKVNVSGNQVHAENNGVQLVMTADDVPTRIAKVYGPDQPQGGWVSRKFDIKLPATSIYFEDDIEGTTSLTTSIRCATQ